MSYKCVGNFSQELERITAMLRRKHPVKTADVVAEKTGIYVETVRKMLALKSAPSFDNNVRLIRAYGAEYIALLFDTPPDYVADAIAADELRQARELAAYASDRIRQLENR